MFTEVYNWLYTWLFNGDIGALTVQGAEFATILLTLGIMFFCVFLACLPFVYLFRLIFR